MTDITKDDLMKSLFGKPVSEQKTEEDNIRRIVEIPLEDIRPFGGTYGEHFFKRREEKITELALSIREIGVIEPIIVRRDNTGKAKYECLAGMTRSEAAKNAGFETIPAEIVNVDDEEAYLIMAASNHQREELFPSEKAKMYAAEYEGMKKQGKRTDLTSGQSGQKLDSIDILAEKSEDSRKQIQRYIKLTKLNQSLLELVDEKKLGFVAGVEISYINKEGQKHILNIMEKNKVKVSEEMAKGLRALPEGTGEEGYRVIMLGAEAKPTQKPVIKLKNNLKKKYFPKEFSDEDVSRLIIELLEKWRRENVEKQ